MLRTAVFGYGNVGRMAARACLGSGDIKLVGVVDPLFEGGDIEGVGKIAKTPEQLPPYDAAILALPSRLVPDAAARLLQSGKHTADSFDIHGDIPGVRARLDGIAKSAGVSAVLAAGWDPGTDSIVRTLLEVMAPHGITHTNFGPGMSMGHSVAARAIAGVRDALSVTIPMGSGIHRRMVYVQLEEGCSIEQAAQAIRADDYFAHDETIVLAVPCVDALRDMGHGVVIERKGVSAGAHNQQFSFDMRVNGPALTAQILVGAIRAAVKQAPGCYTMIEIPPVDFLEMRREDAVGRFV